MSQYQKVNFRRIGSGFCCTVWAPFERGPAYKREDGGLGISLENDYGMHQRALKSFQRASYLQPQI